MDSDTIHRNINALERQLQITQISPIKIIGGLTIVAVIIILAYVFWTQPNSMMEKDSFSWSKMAQLVIASLVGLASLLWILWNVFL